MKIRQFPHTNWMGLVNKKYTEWTTTARTQLINMLGKDRLTIKAHTIQSQHVMVLFIGSHTENPNRTLPFIRISMLLFGCVFEHVVNARARHTADNANAFSWSTKQQYHNQEKWRLVCVYVCLTDNTQNRTHRTVLFELYSSTGIYEREHNVRIVHCLEFQCYDCCNVAACQISWWQ